MTPIYKVIDPQHSRFGFIGTPAKEQAMYADLISLEWHTPDGVGFERYTFERDSVVLFINKEAS